MSAGASRRLALDEFHAGYEGTRDYLIDGVAYLMPTPGPVHCDSVSDLADALRRIAPAGCRVRQRSLS